MSPPYSIYRGMHSSGVSRPFGLLLRAQTPALPTPERLRKSPQISPEAPVDSPVECYSVIVNRTYVW